MGCLRAAGHGLVGLALALAASRDARADPAATKAQADALFREGRRAAARGDWPGACAKFGESQRVDPSTGTLLNLGDCEDHQGHLTVARNYFKDAIRELGPSDPRLARARARLASLDERMPRLTVDLPADAPVGTSVLRDGAPLAAADLGVAVPVDPGAHSLVVVSPGRPDHQQDVALGEAQALRVTATPSPPVPPPAPAIVSVPTASTTATVEASSLVRVPPAAWVAGGLGAAGLILATGSGLVLIHDRNTVDTHCPTKTTCDAAGASAAADGRTWLAVNTASWIVAAAGLGSGLLIGLVGSKASSRATVGVAPLSGGVVAAARVVF